MSRYAVTMSLALIGMSAQCVLAQNYPIRPIRLVVPSSPGGSSDILARILAQKLGDALGQQVVVDNRAGASGVIIDRLHQELVRVLRAPDLKERLAGEGVEALGTTPEELASYIK